MRNLGFNPENHRETHIKDWVPNYNLALKILTSTSCSDLASEATPYSPGSPGLMASPQITVPSGLYQAVPHAAIPMQGGRRLRGASGPCGAGAAGASPATGSEDDCAYDVDETAREGGEEGGEEEGPEEEAHKRPYSVPQYSAAKKLKVTDEGAGPVGAATRSNRK